VAGYSFAKQGQNNCATQPFPDGRSPVLCPFFDHQQFPLMKGKEKVLGEVGLEYIG